MLTRPRRVFYGWWIVAGGFVLQALGGGLLLNSFGAYFVFLQAEFGWSRTLIAGAFSLSRMEGGLLGPLQGWLINRLGPQTTIRLGLLIFGLGFLFLSRIDSLPGFYAAFLLIALGSSLGGFLTVNIVLANWFERYRARAMSIGAMGLSLAGLLVPLVAWSLTSYGWRVTAVASGVLVFILGLPVSQLFRSGPELYGLAPDGATQGPGAGGWRPGGGTQAQDRAPSSQHRALSTQPQATGTQPQAPSTAGLSASEALRTRAFWLLTSGHTMALFAVASVQVHLIPYLVDQRELSIEMAASIFAGLTAFSWAGQLLGGQLGDRLEKRLICACCMVLHTTALVILLLADAPVPLAGGALVHGLAWGMRGPLMMAIRADYFGRRSFATIEGFAAMVTTIGLFFGPLVVGSIADVVGDYRPGFAAVACITAAGFFAFFLARKPVPPPLDVAR